MENTILTRDDIPPNGYPLDDEAKASILEFQDIFYAGVENASIVQICTGLDSLVNRALLYLAEATATAYAWKTHNQPAKLAEKIGEHFDDETVRGFFDAGFNHMRHIFETYHALASSKSIVGEQDAKKNYEDWLDEAFDDFDLFWDIFDTWFENDLYISQEDWEKRKRHGIFARLFSTDASLKEIQVGVESLEDKDLENISAPSLLEYVKSVELDGRYDVAEFLLWKFEDKFSTSNEAMYKLHKLRASLKLRQSDLDAALQHYETALEYTKVYGEWDNRYIQCMADILLLKVKLGKAISDEVRAMYEERAKLYSDETLLSWCKFCFSERYARDEITTQEELTLALDDLLSSGADFQMAPRCRVKFLEWVNDHLAETPEKMANPTAAQRSVLERIVEIARPFGRWAIHLDALEGLIEIAKIDGANMFNMRKLEQEAAGIRNELDLLEEMHRASRFNIKQQNKEGLQGLKDYFSHSVEEGHTLAIERLMELEYWLGKTENYLDHLDAYNGPFTKVVRMVEYARRSKFQRGLRKNAIFQKGREFRGKLLEAAKDATGPWAEAMALGAVLKPHNLAFHRSNDEKMADLTRIIELELSMGSKKLATVYKQRKAEHLERMKRSDEAAALYDEVISEYLETEPKNAYQTYASIVRDRHLCITQPDDVIERCEIIKSQLGENQGDRMEFDCLQAFALASKGGTEDLNRARTVLQTSFDIVMSKPYVNEQNQIRYGRVVSNYLLVDLLEKGEVDRSLTEAIDEQGNFSSMKCLFHAASALKALSTTEAYDVSTKIELVADQLAESNHPYLSLRLLALLAKELDTHEEVVSSDRIKQKTIQLGIKHQQLSFVQTAVYFFNDWDVLQDVFERHDLHAVLASLDPSEDKVNLYITLAHRLPDPVAYLKQALKDAKELGLRRRRDEVMYHLARFTDDVEILDELVQALSDHNSKHAPVMYTRVSKLLFRSTGDVPSNENVLAFVKMYLNRLDDALEKMKHPYDDELNIINGLAKKYGVDGQEWRRDALAEVERFVEKHGGEGDGSIPRAWVAFNRNHTRMLEDEKDSIASWSDSFQSALNGWLKAIENVVAMGEPGSFYEKYYKDLWKVTKRHHAEAHKSALQFCETFVAHLIENETSLPEAKQQRSKLLRAKIHFGTFEFDAGREALSEIVEWSTTATNVLTADQLTALLSMLGALLRRAKQNAPQIVELICKTVETKSFSKHRRQAEKTVKPIITAHLDAFVEARSPFHAQRFEDLLNKVREEHESKALEPAAVLQTYVEEGWSEPEVLALFDTLHRRKALPSFVRKFVRCLTESETPHPLQRNIMIGYYTCLEEFKKRPSLESDEVLSLERIQELLDQSLVASHAHDEELPDWHKKTEAVKQAARAITNPRLKKKATKFLTHSLLDEKNPFDPERSEAYLAWLAGLHAEDERAFSKIKRDLRTLDAGLDIINHFAKLAHKNNKAALATSLYRELLMHPDCKTTLESNTYYRLACLMGDAEEGEKSLMEYIGFKTKEGNNAWIDRLLLCLFILKHHGLQERVEIIAKAALKEEHVRIFHQTEGEVLDGGNVRLGAETFATTYNHTKGQPFPKYLEGLETGNDALFAVLNDEGVITKFFHFRPHIQVLEAD